MQGERPLSHQLNDLEVQIKQIQMKPIDQRDQALEDSLATRYEQTLT